MMSFSQIHWVVLSLCFQSSFQTTPEDPYYIAAVVEYNSHWSTNGSTPRENIIFNSLKYAEIIESASKYKVDIIVFPEIGLTNYDHTEYVVVPDPDKNIIPANNSSQDEVLQIISSAAMKGSMYVVINLHEIYRENKETYKYNTNIVFDRNGAIIAKYRKFNLFGEFYLNTTKGYEVVTFDTDFGVRFGTFICFDIIFEHPSMDYASKGVFDIVFPTAWFHEIPIWTGIQSQASWSYANNMNLLAANHNDVKRGSSGSGLFRGMTIKPIFKQSAKTGSFMIVGKMAKHGFSVADNLTESDRIVSINTEKIDKVFAAKDNITRYKTAYLSSTKDFGEEIYVHGELVGHKYKTNYNERMCGSNFCCNFNVTFTSTYYLSSYKPVEPISPNDFWRFKYRLALMNGERDFNPINRTAWIQSCTIIPCINSSLSSCFDVPKEGVQNQHKKKNQYLYSTSFDLINITGEYENNKRTLILPNILLSSSDPDNFGEVLSPNDMRFSLTESKTKIFANVIFSANKLITGGFLGRVFTKDRIQPSKNNANYAKCTNTTMVLLCLLFILSYVVQKDSY